MSDHILNPVPAAEIAIGEENPSPRPLAEVVMVDLNTVLVNGVPAGCLIDAVMNNRYDSPAIHDAFMAWMLQHDADLVAAQQAKADEAIRQLQISFNEREEALRADVKVQTDYKDQFRQSAENWLARYQEVVTANQQMNAKVQEQQTHLQASANLINVLVTGKGDAAVTAARELSRLNAIARQRSAEAELAEHDRLMAAAATATTDAKAVA